MRLLTGFKREISCADGRIVLVSTLLCWIAGLFILLLAGAAASYACLYRPGLAPGAAAWLILMQGSYALLGIVSGLLLGRCLGCRQRILRRAVILWGLCFLASILWPILFFGAGWTLIGLLILTVSIVFGLSALLPIADESLLAAVLLLCWLFWQLYSFLLALLIILWN